MSDHLNAEVVDICKIGDDKAILRLLPKGDFDYIAGQYIELTIGGNDSRFYSIANPPRQKEIEIYIKDNGRGGASSYVLQSLRKNEIVLMRGPFGKCVWSRDINKPLLLIGGGVGIAPLKAIVEHALLSAHPFSVSLYWGRELDIDTYIADRLDALTQKHEFFHYEDVLDGVVDFSVVESCVDLHACEIYLAGPPEMVSAAREFFLKRDVKNNSIHSDY